ncbi:MAG: DUF4878 domain-containing protein [Bacteroidales bacterium]|nr:DUF4878 domain-containing protein [Bacteroidales bacterium]
MRKIVTLFLMLTVFLGSAQAWKPTKGEAKKITKGFISAVMSGDLKKSLDYFAYEYVREQHDGFLEGRTEQFVMEFIGGVPITKEGKQLDFVTPTLQNIASIKIKDVVIIGEEMYSVIEVKLKDGSKYSTDLNIVTVDGEMLRFWGAVG